MKIKKYGAIDIGSNAVRLLVANVIEEKDKEPQFKKSSLVRVPIRLGADAFVGGIISKENTNRMIDAMEAFKLLMKVHGVEKYKACATSAMREAENGNDVISTILKKTEIAIDIIDGKKATAMVSLSDEETLIKEKDLPALIKIAITDGNFKLATRYYYLLLLKKLSEKELIFWQQEKTNEDYIKELASNKNLYKEFETLTHLYDYVWYGEFLINKEKFLKAEINFKKMIAKI